MKIALQAQNLRAFGYRCEEIKRLPMALSVFETNLDELRRNRGWLLAMGIVLVLLGIIALIDSLLFLSRR